jgi:hypothetical protein
LREESKEREEKTMTTFGSTLRRRVAAAFVVLPLVLGATSAYADSDQAQYYHSGADTVRQFEVESPIKTEVTRSEAVVLGDDGNGVITFGLVGGPRVVVPAIPSKPGTLPQPYQGDAGSYAGDPLVQ